MPIELKIMATNAFELRGELRAMGYVHEEDVTKIVDEAVGLTMKEGGAINDTPAKVAERVMAQEPTVDQVSAEAVSEKYKDVPDPAPKKRGRPRKTTPVVIPQEADDTPVPMVEQTEDEPEVKQPKEITLELVRGALFTLVKTPVGMDGAAKLLEKYGAQKVSELKPEVYAEFRKGVV